MRVVLFDDETMEPLTVLTLPIWAHEILRANVLALSSAHERRSALPSLGLGNNHALPDTNLRTS
jgi:hypothetical protein